MWVFLFTNVCINTGITGRDASGLVSQIRKREGDEHLWIAHTERGCWARGSKRLVTQRSESCPTRGGQHQSIHINDKRGQPAASRAIVSEGDVETRGAICPRPAPPTANVPRSVVDVWSERVDALSRELSSSLLSSSKTIISRDSCRITTPKKWP